MLGIFQKNNKERKRDILFEVKLNGPFILLWLVGQFGVLNDKMQRVVMIGTLWMAIINTTSLVGLGWEYILRVISARITRKTNSIRPLFPMSYVGLISKLFFMAVYLVIVFSNDALRKSFLFVAPYVWVGWLIFWVLIRLWTK